MMVNGSLIDLASRDLELFKFGLLSAKLGNSDIVLEQI